MDPSLVLLEEQSEAMAAMTRVVPNLKKQGKGNFTVAAIHRRINRLQELMLEVRQRHAHIKLQTNGETKETHAYFTENQYSICEDNCSSDLDYLDSLMVSQPPVSTAITVPGPAAPSAISLPAIKLPTFDGSLTQWESFRDQFVPLIINNQKLSNAERMHYLSSALQGSAFNVIKRLPISDTSFDTAWTLLNTRYNNRRQLVYTHLHELHSLPSVTAKSADSVQALHDQLTTAVAALRSLKIHVEAWDDMLVYLALQKFDAATREAWESRISDNSDLPSFAMLINFLEARTRALESMKPAGTSRNSATNANSSTSKQVTSHASSAATSNCSVCNKQPHGLWKCESFLQSSTERRNAIVREHLRCINCLAASHNIDACPSQHRCRHCRQKHHSLLHKIEDHSEAANESLNERIADAVASHSALRTSPLKLSRILLATATLHAHSDQGHVVRVRALLDQGSEVTVISENLVQLLHLQKSKQYTRIHGIGGSTSLSQYVARILIGPTCLSTPTHSAVALITKSVTPFRPPRTSMEVAWSHLANLKLADEDPLGDTPIDILIGADLYGSILLDGICRGSSSEPIAQNTVFGWILSGPVSRERDESVVTSHAVTLSRLDQDLRQFWEVEEIPSDNNLNPDEIRCEEHFRESHSRREDGRYVVRLPFETAPPDNFGDSRSSALNHLRRSEARLRRDSAEATAHATCMSEYENLGHMKLIPDSEIGKSAANYYIPHHAVSAGTKLQVDQQSIRDYRLSTVTYDTTSAPFLALRVLQQLTIDDGASHPLATPVLQHHTYVDDCLLGADSEDSAIQTRDQLTALLQRRGFSPHKRAANQDSLLPNIYSDNGTTLARLLTMANRKALFLPVDFNHASENSTHAE